MGLTKEIGKPDNGPDDDSNFNSPMEMLGNSLKTPAIKALGNSGDALREFSRKYGIGRESKDEGKQEKKKNKK